MSQPTQPRPDEVEHLLRNAQLRDELEPYFDESILRLNVFDMPTPVENEFLASMLAWERAPTRPIADWFQPELRPPHPATLTGDELKAVLWDTIHKLFSRGIVLEFTEHLSDARLYQLIFRDILPSPEKQIDRQGHYLHWDCADAGENPDIWLRYYASDAEREQWAESSFESLPPSEPPPFPRKLPRRPL